MIQRFPFRHNRIRGLAVAAALCVLAAPLFVLVSPAAASAPDGAESTTAAEATSEPPAEVTGEPAADAPAAEPAAPASADTPANEAPEAAPQLSIAIDNGRASTTTGDLLDYTITVQNLGTTDIGGLQVSQTRPEGLRFESADGGESEQPGVVVWTLDLATGQTGTLHSTMTVLATPDDLLRLATVACVKIAADAPPIVCAAHSDQLPAGAKAEADQASMSASPAEVANQDRMGWYIGGGIAALAVVVVTLTLLRMRSRRRALAEEAGRGGPPRQQRDGLVDNRSF